MNCEMFPRIMHFIWIQGFPAIPEDRRGNPSQWAAINPDWETWFWDGDDLRKLVTDRYPDLLETWDSLEKPVMKSDMGRLLVLHAHGGLYLDCDLQPLRRATETLNEGVVYNRTLRSSSLPDFPSIDVIDINNFQLVLSRENCNIDSIGAGIANGAMMAKPGCAEIMEFVSTQSSCANGLVLDFMGTWALTRFVRSRISQLRGVATILPPHYFLWERRFMKCEPPEYCISVHPAENSWGDKTKERYWKV